MITLMAFMFGGNSNGGTHYSLAIDILWGTGYLVLEGMAK